MATEAVPIKTGVSIPKLSGDFGVSEALLYSLANAGSLPGCRRLGKRFVIHLPTFERWLAEGMGDDVEPVQAVSK